MRTPQTADTSSGLSGYKHRISVVLAQPAFRWYWMGSSTQAVAQGAQFLVIGWLVLEVTGSLAQLGLAIFFYGLPNVAFLLVAGVIADRFDRRYILMTTQGSVGVFIALLGFLTIADLINSWHIYAASALLGMFQALNMPARMSIIADLVEQRSLLDAVAIQNAAVHAGRMIGPPVVGAIIELWGIGAGLFVITGFYVLSIGLVTKIGRTSQPRPTTTQSPFRNFAEGLIYVKNNPLVLTVIVISCSFGGFGMSHMQIIPGLAKDVLETGAAGAGLLLLANGIGSLTGTMLLPLIGHANVYRWLLISLVIFTVLLSLFSWSTWFWVSWVLFLMVGVTSLGMIWALATTMVQRETPAEMRGRAMGILQFTPGFHFLGAFPLALAAGQLGWGPAITGAAALCLAVTVWFALVRSGAPKLNPQTAEDV